MRQTTLKRLIATVSGLALAVALGMANAADLTGKIDKIGADHTWFSLTDGTQFSPGEGVSLKGLKAASEAMVTYDVHEGKNVASKIAKAQAKVSKPEPKKEQRSY